MRRLIVTLALTFVTGWVVPGAALANHDGMMMISPGTTSTAAGEVRLVNKAAGKVTLNHGPLPELSMPAMTMDFQVKDPAMLDTLKVGDRIKLTATIEGGAMVLISYEQIK